MADFDKINIDSVSYLVKDSKARASIAEMTSNSILATDLGIVPNSADDQAAAIETAFQTHKSIIFPAGTYLLGRAISLPAGCGLIGCGVNITSFVFTSANGGITIATSSAGKFFNGCTIRDISILARTFVSGAGITIDGRKSVVDRVTMFPHLTNVHVGPETYNSTTAGFNSGIDMQNCNCSSLMGVSVVGASNYAGRWDSDYGIRITGDSGYSIGTENLLTNINVKGFNYGVYAGFTEGVQIANSVLVGNNYGVYWDDGARAHPHLAIVNSHLASAASNVVCKRILQGMLLGNLFYNRKEGSVAPMVDLDQNCSQWTISGNVFYNAYTEKIVPGVAIAGDHMAVTGNQFALLSADCIQLSSTASYITISGVSSSGTGLYVKNKASQPAQIKSDYNARTDLNPLHSSVSALANSWFQITAAGVHVHFAFTATSNIPQKTTLYRVTPPTRLNPIASVAYLGVLPGSNTHSLVTFAINEDGYVTNNLQIDSGYQFVVDLFLTYNHN